MIKKFKDAKEKGAIIVFTALLLPLMMICVGLAFDLGNLYVHKTRLQNAADAAALAGAREFAVNNETKDSHPYADAEARTYAEKNAEENNLPNSISFKQGYPKAVEDESAIYYRVILNETVPLYFLRIIGKEQQDVSASAIAAIAWSVAEENKSGDELFIVKSHFDAVNAVNNPDTVTMAGQVSTTFDGNIVCTDGTGASMSEEAGKAYYNNMLNNGNFQYSSQTAGLQAFIKSAARDANLSIEDAVIKDVDMKYHSEGVYEAYDETALPAQVRSLLGLPSYSEYFPNGTPDWTSSQAEWDAYGVSRDAYRAAAGGNFKDVNSGYKNINSSTLSEGNVALTTTGDGNVAFNIDGAISGSASDPVYVYIDETVNQSVNLDVTASNGRPVIFVYNGTAQVAFNIASGTTFSGYVYAPHASQVIVNAYGGNFEGTIMADNLTLRGDHATYKYKDFGVGGSTGQGSKQRVLRKTSSIKLANPSNISWD